MGASNGIIVAIFNPSVRLHRARLFWNMKNRRINRLEPRPISGLTPDLAVAALR